jgi:preprotein translocase subunit SecD
MYAFFNRPLHPVFCCAFYLMQAIALLQAHAGHAKVEFRLAEIAPAPGLTAVKVDGPLQKIYLHKGVIITAKDVIEASASEDPVGSGQYQVRVVFTERGAQRMAKATEPEKGLLAILINGKVVAAMGIPRRIHDEAKISGMLTKREA